MGLIRKVTSISTLGAVDFRSAKDRTASSTAKTAKEAKKQTQIMRQQAAAGAGYQQPVAAASAAPGWYKAPNDPAGTERLWDGSAWTTNVRPAQV